MVFRLASRCWPESQVSGPVRRAASWCCLSGLSCIAGVACVPSVPHFVSSAETRAGFPYENAEFRSADLVGSAEARPGESSAKGYWHYNGLEYEFVTPEAEGTAPGYLWAWQD